MIVSVAWVPDDDPEPDWDIAAGLAAAWVDDRCRDEGAGVSVDYGKVWASDGP